MASDKDYDFIYKKCWPLERWDLSFGSGKKGCRLFSKFARVGMDLFLSAKEVTLMGEAILLGRGRQMVQIPRKQWEEHLSLVPERQEMRLRFMSRDHHRVRNFVVRELPRVGMPIEPPLISRNLHLPVDRVLEILDELERNLFFLVRNEQGAVSWAFPVTVEPTPHHVGFSTGECLYAA